MTKIDIISGFLGAGKTTFIQKLLDTVLKSEQVVLIENEFGEISIDSGFLKDSGIEIREINQGCICCTLVGDFETSLKEVVEKYHPDRIIIEPSGVGKLSDIIGAVRSISKDMEVELHAAVTVVDARKARMYSKNFGEFFNNQIEYAGTVVLSRTDISDEKKVREAVEIVRQHNGKAVIITTAIKELSGEKLMEIISAPDTMEEDLLKEAMERVHEHEHHHDEEDDDEAEEEHHHHHTHLKHDEEEGHHHEHHEHHNHDEEEGHHHHDHEDEHDGAEGHHEHHHDEDEGHHHEHHHHDEVETREDGVQIHRHSHDHHHHHHGHDHDADEIFTSWGLETPHAFPRERLEKILSEMANSDKYGMVVRCKGMLKEAEEDGKSVDSADNNKSWMYFDMVPEQTEIRSGSPDYTGKVVVIGAELNEKLLEEAFL